MGHHYRHIDMAERRQIMKLLERKVPLSQIAKIVGRHATAAARLNTRAENIEKDLYVCWILDFLFNRRAEDRVRLYFKGGTSLAFLPRRSAMASQMPGS